MATKPKRASLATPMYMEDYQCEDDLRTLVRAEEIKKDPKRFAKVTALAKKKMMDMAAVATEDKDD